MASKDILPAISKYSKELADTISAKKKNIEQQMIEVI